MTFNPRYLAAKKSVDDRALNKDVWRTFAEKLPEAPEILEVGAGIGTMVERLAELETLAGGNYTAVDNQPENIAAARERFKQRSLPFTLTFETIDFFDLIKQQRGQKWDALIAHAFLDLMDIPATLPEMFSLLKEKGLFYFSLNFDGVTVFEPEIDPELDALIVQLYHQTMDERVTNGRVSGDSRSGRHLFHVIPQCGAEIIAAGSSDWVVYAGADGYPADEACFLHGIIQFINSSLQRRPEIDGQKLAEWIRIRQAQIEDGKLVYMAHQLDFVGRIN